MKMNDLKQRLRKDRPMTTVTLRMPEDVIDDEPEEEARGKDGLTDAERAQKRYERRQAERARAQAKAQARKKKQNQNKKPRNF